jgi:Uma2 family endonuclease
VIQTEQRANRPDTPPARSPRREAPPALERGDVMTRAEFERRYWLRPDLKKAELVEGVVHVTSPLRSPHSTATVLVVTWLGHYMAQHPNVEAGDSGTVRLDLDNEFQPDAFLRFRDDAGGQSRIDEDKFVAGAPELVVEVAHSSVSRDLHAKKRVYQRTGVREYIVWRLEDCVIDWFALADGAFTAREPDADGIIESAVFAGLRLDVGAMLRGDLAGVLAAVAGSGA